MCGTVVVEVFVVVLVGIARHLQADDSRAPAGKVERQGGFATVVAARCSSSRLISTAGVLSLI
jgi:hypothetical protein